MELLLSKLLWMELLLSKLLWMELFLSKLLWMELLLSMEQAPLDGTIVEQAPLDGTIVEQAPLDGNIVQQAPLDGNIVQQAPLDGTIVQQAPLDGTIVQQAPWDGTIVQQTPLDGTIVMDISLNNVAAMESSCTETPHVGVIPVDLKSNIHSPVHISFKKDNEVNVGTINSIGNNNREIIICHSESGPEEHPDGSNNKTATNLSNINKPDVNWDIVQGNELSSIFCCANTNNTKNTPQVNLKNTVVIPIQNTTIADTPVENLELSKSINDVSCECSHLRKCIQKDKRLLKIKRNALLKCNLFGFPKSEYGNNKKSIYCSTLKKKDYCITTGSYTHKQKSTIKILNNAKKFTRIRTCTLTPEIVKKKDSHSNPHISNMHDNEVHEKICRPNLQNITGLDNESSCNVLIEDIISSDNISIIGHGTSDVNNVNEKIYEPNFINNSPSEYSSSSNIYADNNSASSADHSHTSDEGYLNLDKQLKLPSSSSSSASTASSSTSKIVQYHCDFTIISPYFENKYCHSDNADKNISPCSKVNNTFRNVLEDEIRLSDNKNDRKIEDIRIDDSPHVNENTIKCSISKPVLKNMAIRTNQMVVRDINETVPYILQVGASNSTKERPSHFDHVSRYSLVGGEKGERQLTHDSSSDASACVRKFKENKICIKKVLLDYDPLEITKYLSQTSQIDMVMGKLAGAAQNGVAENEREQILTNESEEKVDTKIVINILNASCGDILLSNANYTKISPKKEHVCKRRFRYAALKV